MAKKISIDSIKNELEESAFFNQTQNNRETKRIVSPVNVVTSQRDIMTSDTDIATSDSDVTTSHTDIMTSSRNKKRTTTKQTAIHTDRLEMIIKSLSDIKTSTFTTPIRLSEQEKRDVEDFIYIKLRKKGLQGKDVSISKLMRYCVRYMIKVHEEELVNSLQKVLAGDEVLST